MILYESSIQKKLKIDKEFLIFLLTSGIFVLFFLGFHYFHYGHFFGLRYIQNVALSDYSLKRQLIFMFKLLFFGESINKIGFFGYLPIFLFVSFFVFFKIQILNSFENKLLFYSTFLSLLVLSFLSPNDGVVNLVPRYLILGVFPYLVITQKILFHFQKKKLLYILFFYSFFLGIIYLLLLNNFLKTTKSIYNLISLEKSDFYITFHDFDSGNASLMLLEKPFIKIEKEIDQDLILKIKKFISNDKIFIIYYSSFVKSQKEEIIKKNMEIFLNSFQLIDQKETYLNKKFYIKFYKFKNKDL